MRRADRLFKIVQLIRGRRLSTAQWQVDRVEVSARTVYSDRRFTHDPGNTRKDFLATCVPPDEAAPRGLIRG